MHYGKDCTWVWSRVLISHSAAPRAILASRPHPRTIFSVMHSRGNLTSTYRIIAIVDLMLMTMHNYSLNKPVDEDDRMAKANNSG